MTRAEILDALSGYTFPPVSQVGAETWQRIHDAMAFELGKTCATCLFYVSGRGVPWSACAAKGGMHRVPQDGTGYCCYWQSGERAR